MGIASEVVILELVAANLLPILHRFKAMADYWSNFR